MNNYWHLNDDQKRIVLQQASIKIGLPVESVEKDLWVTAILQSVFSLPHANKFVFKGGTSQEIFIVRKGTDLSGPDKSS